MLSPHGVVLDVATLQDALLLANLLRLYIYDLSETFSNIELEPMDATVMKGFRSTGDLTKSPQE